MVVVTNGAEIGGAATTGAATEATIGDHLSPSIQDFPLLPMPIDRLLGTAIDFGPRPIEALPGTETWIGIEMNLRPCRPTHDSQQPQMITKRNALIGRRSLRIVVLRRR